MMHGQTKIKFIYYVGYIHPQLITEHSSKRKVGSAEWRIRKSEGVHYRKKINKKEKRPNICSPKCIPTHRPNVGLNNLTSLININLKFLPVANFTTHIPTVPSSQMRDKNACFSELG